MESGQRERRELIAAWLLGIAALVVKLVPGRFPADYDEGVYVTAARALAAGAWPYRDFIFVHPPGILLWLQPLTGLAPDAMFLIARVLSSLVGAFSVVVLARLIGGLGGLGAGLVWAFWYGTLNTDRGVFLEPLMVGAGLGALFFAHRATSLRGWALAGALLGLSVAFKSWGVFWGLLVVATTPGLKARGIITLVSLVTFAVVIGPFVARAPDTFVTQTLLVHLRRPPDGNLETVVRLSEMFGSRSSLGSVLVAFAIPFLFFSPRRNLGLAALGVSALVSGALLSAAAYWNQYNSALNCFLIIVVGVGLDGAVRRFGARVLVAPVLVAALWARGALGRPPSRDDEVRTLERLRELDGELCAFENFELIVANREPSTKVALIDPYGQQLLEATVDGARFVHSNEAFASEAAQLTLRRQLPRCDWLRTGWRGDWQMNAGTKAMVAEQFEPVGEGLFRRRR